MNFRLSRIGQDTNSREIPEVTPLGVPRANYTYCRVASRDTLSSADLIQEGAPLSSVSKLCACAMDHYFSGAYEYRARLATIVPPIIDIMQRSSRNAKISRRSDDFPCTSDVSHEPKRRTRSDFEVSPYRSESRPRGVSEIFIRRHLTCHRERLPGKFMALVNRRGVSVSLLPR